MPNQETMQVATHSGPVKVAPHRGSVGTMCLVEVMAKHRQTIGLMEEAFRSGKPELVKLYLGHAKSEHKRALELLGIEVAPARSTWKPDGPA